MIAHIISSIGSRGRYHGGKNEQDRKTENIRHERKKRKSLLK